MSKYSYRASERPRASQPKQRFSLGGTAITGLSLPYDVEPYGPGDSAYAAEQRILRRVIDGVGKRFAQYVVVDGKFATASFLHTASDLGLVVVARLKDFRSRRGRKSHTAISTDCVFRPSACPCPTLLQGVPQQPGRVGRVSRASALRIPWL